MKVQPVIVFNLGMCLLHFAESLLLSFQKACAFTANFKEKRAKILQVQRAVSGAHGCLQLRQFIHRCVEFEVGRKEIGSTGVNETVRLTYGDVCHSSNVPDLCVREK